MDKISLNNIYSVKHTRKFGDVPAVCPFESRNLVQNIPQIVHLSFFMNRWFHRRFVFCSS